MTRYCLLCLATILLFVPAGCEKSAEPRPQARVAKAGLMPDGDPAFEPDYVANQSSVKLAPARTVSYEPLDTFRERNAAAAKARLDEAQNKDAGADSEKTAEASDGSSTSESMAKKLTDWIKGNKKAEGKQGDEEGKQVGDDDEDDDSDDEDDLDDDDEDLDDEDDLDDDDDLDDEDPDDDEDD